MNKTIKTALSLLCSAAAVVSFGGCGGSASSGSGPIELKFLTWNLKTDKFTGYFQDLIKQFE